MTKTEKINKAFEEMSKAMDSIVRLWDDLSEDQLATLTRMYPFGESFDEVSANVAEWQRDVESNLREPII